MEFFKDSPAVSLELAWSLANSNGIVIWYERSYHFKDPRFGPTQKRCARRDLSYPVSHSEKEHRNFIAAFPTTILHRKFLRHLNFKKIEKKLPASTRLDIAGNFAEILNKRHRL